MAGGRRQCSSAAGVAGSIRTVGWIAMAVGEICAAGLRRGPVPLCIPYRPGGPSEEYFVLPVDRRAFLVAAHTLHRGDFHRARALEQVRHMLIAFDRKGL